MTEEEGKEWNDRACVWRCLIELANRKGKPITIDEFAGQFKKLFPNRRISDGSFDPETLSKICGLLGLPAHCQMSNGYLDIEREFNSNNRDILVLSEIDLRPGHTNIGKHCSLLTKIDPKSFSVWTPSQGGSEDQLELNKDCWTAKKCSGIAVF
jgi:hypothetical protein